jgi:hypothetical protein
MRQLLAGTCLVLAAFAMLGQQAAPRPTPMVGMQPTPKPELLEIYQLDLVPSGSAFALNKPVLDGDVYVFRVWPERDTVRLPKAKVRQIKPRTKDLDAYVVWQIDLVPTGRVVSKQEPELKNGSYVFNTWKEDKLMSLRQADVKKVQRVQGLPAFKIQQEEKGAALIGNLPMEGGGSVIVFSEPPPEAINPANYVEPAITPNVGGNVQYYGQPGVTDAYAPPNAVVAEPGDVPKAAPTQPPK